MIDKPDLLKLLNLPESADLAAVRENIRALKDKDLDRVSAISVMGWELHDQIMLPHYHIDEYHDKLMQLWRPTKDLNQSSIIIEKIESIDELGWQEFTEELSSAVQKKEMPNSKIWNWNDADRSAWKDYCLIRASARDYTEAAVNAFAIIVMRPSTCE